MAIICVIPKTHAECNQLVSLLHSKNIQELPTAEVHTVKPNMSVCIWSSIQEYEFGRDDGFEEWCFQHLTVNQLASKLK
ncbi:hypothetical protein [Acinetobacter phage vB_AbaP_IME546]|uniref:Uncharacterized protein n=3 Tax=Friunavirus TaxID=1985711 RepID=A0A5J6TX45_9CAUD|nr:hypothetical protein FDJ49_gp26 [Acinetobacter phage vB_AbaP_D2]AVP40496.1 hypothetical protein vBAbaPD2_26 [Acinetobacter phage vB_AbaP_D2]QFG15423.1 hypothetical protein vBAbaPD2M_29 [Acinetobacter phage vB_AbaP_D2M]QFR59010.1 hypothetical protein [Acinetobacter phage vB_AbaP_IME546]QGJ97504.1 hypothetical protein [Acinetobacter phage vB_AbaP_IME546]